MVIMFFAEAFSWAVLACGLWSLACGYSLMEKPGRVPSWFKTGNTVAALIGVVVGFFVRR